MRKDQFESVIYIPEPEQTYGGMRMSKGDAMRMRHRGVNAHPSRIVTTYDPRLKIHVTRDNQN